MANKWGIYPPSWWPRAWWPYVPDSPDIPAVEVFLDLRPAEVHFVIKEVAVVDAFVCLEKSDIECFLPLISEEEEIMDLAPAQIEVSIGGLA